MPQAKTRFKKGEKLYWGGCVPLVVLDVIPGRIGTKHKEHILVDFVEYHVGPEWIRSDTVNLSEGEFISP